LKSERFQILFSIFPTDVTKAGNDSASAPFSEMQGHALSQAPAAAGDDWDSHLRLLSSLDDYFVG
jgi:hypothetical protein